MKKLILLLILSLPLHAFLNYDRAIVHGQKGNWAPSMELLKNELVQNPENPQLLYDTGVSTYKNGDYEHALSYFNKAAQSSDASALLQEQALFNAGNAQVALKQLPEALKTFEQLLERNPKNAKAAHNKEIVKKMLEEQKQQQQQQDQQKKNNENKKDNQNKKSDQSQQNTDQKEKNEQDQNQNNQQQQEPKQNQEQKKEKEDEQSSQTPQQSQKQTQDSSSHESQKEEKENAQQQVTPTVARLLDEREKRDAQLNKQLMRMMAGTQKAGADHNEHYW